MKAEVFPQVLHSRHIIHYYYVRGINKVFVDWWGAMLTKFKRNVKQQKF